MMRLLPLGTSATAIAAAVVFAVVYFRRVIFSGALARTHLVLLGALVLARVLLSIGVPQPGWTARYYANESFAGPAEWSSEFPGLGATRIDRRISFTKETFPAYYLNDVRFEQAGVQREIDEPMSVQWTGFARFDSALEADLEVTASGAATVTIDGSQVVNISSTSDPGRAVTPISLSPGVHAFEVRYVKPRGTAGSIDVSAPFEVLPAQAAVGGASRRALETLATLVDGALLLLAAYLVVRLARAAVPYSASQITTLFLFAVFGLQGWWQASAFAGRLVVLNPGDDWFGYESRARDILAHGPLMTFGKPIGQGDPYFWHPLYSYFLAGVHAITGESLFGPVFVQFLILAAVGALMYRFAERHFGAVPAAAGIGALFVIFQLDFARYYTVTLLTENLYILTVTLTLLPFVRWIDTGSRSDLVRTAFWGGVCSITRPAMMFFFGPALALIAIISYAKTRRLRAVGAAAGLAAAVWLLAISPVTARNWVMSNRFVLISDVSSRLFDLLQHMPPDILPTTEPMQSSGSARTELDVLLGVAKDHPWALLLFQARKLGFAAGMTQWFGGYRAHPELIGVTLLYLAMCLLDTPLRDRRFWPIHLFVATHFATMTLTIPWNYGYRLIIPPFVYISTLSVAALTGLAGRRFAHASSRQRRVPVGPAA